MIAERCPELQFAQRSAEEIGQQSADQLPWAHMVSQPELFHTNLLSIEEIEAELSRDMEGDDRA